MPSAMPANTFDAIVLGLGGMGSAAAFELARRGLKVLGLEQFSLGHDRGSSHGQTRIIRTCYFEHPAYVPLVLASFTHWYDLEQRADKHLLTESPCLIIGRPDSEVVTGVRRAATTHGLAMEDLSARDIASRYPVFHFDDSFVGILEHQAGMLHVESCVQTFLDQAQSLGAELHASETVRSWKTVDNAVEVHTDRATYHAGKLVVTAGAWAASMLADLGLPLHVRRQPLLWFGSHNLDLLRRDRMPIYLVDLGTHCFYGMPALDPAGTKTARHDTGDPVDDPSAVNRDLLPRDEADCRAFLQAHLPVANGKLNRHQVCMYTMTPDQHFILDTHPLHPQITLAAGMSGHGFKFAPVIGTILTDLALNQQTTYDITMFRTSRFEAKK